VLLLTRKS